LTFIAGKEIPGDFLFPRKNAEHYLCFHTKPTAMEEKRVYRSRTDRVLGGVCSGLGKYFGLDPVLLRVLWAIAFFIGGAGLLAYIIAWIIIPEEPMV
jgi:phage shock protein C